MTIEIQEEPEELIKVFMRDETTRLVKSGAEFGFSMSYLKVEDDLFNVTKNYGLYLDEKLVGFAILPAFGKSGSLIRMYVMPRARRKGVARKAVEVLGIRQLACLLQDHKAQRAWEGMGFVLSKGIAHNPSFVHYSRPA